ncbi:transcriptional regulator [Stutzerimonas stutzeri]|nr:transcriptional regulator [Stutzerimonas stutzeri]
MQSGMRLSKHKLIGLLEVPEYQDFFARFRRRSFSAGAVVSIPNTGQDDVFFVVRGRLRVYLSYNEREFSLCFLDPGDIFTTHTKAFIEAVEDSELMMASARIFRGELLQHPEILLAIIGVLGEVLSGSWGVIEGLVFHDVKSRLVAYFLSRARENGRFDGKRVTFDCTLTMEEISMTIGSSRQTTSSLFNNLIRDGDLVRMGKHRFLIEDIDRLEQKFA